jgi:hypothetical protein
MNKPVFIPLAWSAGQVADYLDKLEPDASFDPPTRQRIYNLSGTGMVATGNIVSPLVCLPQTHAADIRANTIKRATEKLIGS